MISLQLHDSLLRLSPIQLGTAASPMVKRYRVTHDDDENFTACIAKKLISVPSPNGYSRTTKMKWVIEYPPAKSIHLSEWDTRKKAFRVLRNWLRDQAPETE